MAAITQYASLPIALQVCRCQLDVLVHAADFTLRHPCYPEPSHQILGSLLTRWHVHLRPGEPCPGDIDLVDLGLTLLQLTILTGAVQGALRHPGVPPCVRRVLTSMLDKWRRIAHDIDPRLGAGMAIGDNPAYDVPVITPMAPPRQCFRQILFCSGCGCVVNPCGCEAIHATRHVTSCGSCAGYALP
jgi:hypothetical protein